MSSTRTLRTSLPAPAAEGDEGLSVERFLAGEPESVSRAYRAYAPLLGRLVSRLGVEPHEVDDLVHIAFLEALRNAARFRGESSLRGWLVGIALNQARTHVRNRARARRGAFQWAGLRGEADESGDAESALGDARERARLAEALTQLPPLQREAIVLCELEGLSAKEVSAMLGVPCATLWRRVHDAKASLRRLLSAAEGGAS
ncbi:MAG TPA: RNA polymerase sigma factor [Polyangiaceae bacterium]|nr:RNA polymerase sigma factor [Polyangiaceae bacterium]